VVSTEWLHANLAELKTGKKYLLIDVRPQQAYRDSHIAHAINIPTDFTFGGRGNESRIGSPSKIRSLFSRFGIQNHHHVILYDNGNLKNAARFFWVLETYGHRKISIVNGGFQQWKHKGLPVSQETKSIKPSNYVPVIQHHYLATKLATRLAIENNNVSIIDSRVPTEYKGKKTKAMRHGHIPSAINIPWYKNVNMNQPMRSIKSIDELKQIYKPVNKNNRVITYCNRGKESAVTYFILRVLGYDVSTYDGAWLEWGNDYNLPINTVNNSQ
jgi:thiosulfate/3-mercaptopyruvate sulfurtransferase